MPYFEYGDREIEYLKKKDKKLAAAIERIGNIRRGMMNLYGLKELTKEKFLRYRKRYSPYGSVASLYLWRLSVTDSSKAGGI